MIAQPNSPLLFWYFLLALTALCVLLPFAKLEIFDICLLCRELFRRPTVSCVCVSVFSILTVGLTSSSDSIWPLSYTHKL